MIRIKVSADDLMQTRFAFSPLWEVVASYRVLVDPGQASGTPALGKAGLRGSPGSGPATSGRAGSRPGLHPRLPHPAAHHPVPGLLRGDRAAAGDRGGEGTRGVGASEHLRPGACSRARRIQGRPARGGRTPRRPPGRIPRTGPRALLAAAVHPARRRRPEARPHARLRGARGALRRPAPGCGLPAGGRRDLQELRAGRGS